MESRDDGKIKLDQQILKLQQDLQNELYDLQGGLEEDIDVPDSEDDPYHQVNEIQRQIDDLKKNRRKIEIDDENEKKRHIFDGFSNNMGSAITDVESDIDLLSRMSQAETISRLIANKETSPPLTIGIYGPWGRGKSTFLRLIEKQLGTINKEIEEKREGINTKYNKTHLIRFNPTEYDDQNMIWYAILKELYLKYDAEKGFRGRILYAFRRLVPSFKRNKAPYIMNSILILLNVFLISIYSNQYSTMLNLLKNSNLYINLLTIIVSFTALFQVILPAFKKMHFLFKPVSAKMIQHMLIPNYKAKLGTREEVKGSLSDLLNIWINNNEKIVMLVDELDRCSEKTIVEFFSALQLFISFNSIINVISMNEETVALALANSNNFHFQSNITKEERLKFGLEYLQKYITIPFHLPVERSYERFLNVLLNHQTEFFVQEERETIVSMIADMTRVREITPRELKKIINLLILSKERVFADSERYKYKLSFTEFIKWFLVDYFNPQGTRYFISKIGLKIHYNEHEFKFFKEVYPSLLPPRDGDDKDKNSILYLRKYLDSIRIELIFIADKIIESSFIRGK